MHYLSFEDCLTICQTEFDKLGVRFRCLEDVGALSISQKLFLTKAPLDPSNNYNWDVISHQVVAGKADLGSPNLRFIMREIQRAVGRRFHFVEYLEIQENKVNDLVLAGQI